MWRSEFVLHTENAIQNIQQQQSITPPQTNQFKNQQTDEYEERGRAKGKDTVCQSTNTQLPSTQDQTVLKYQSQGPMRSRSTNDTSVLANRRKAINKRTGSEQLLLTAINQNHQSKSKLTRSISSQGVNTLQQQQQQQHLHHYHRTPQLPLQSKKNIPMVNNELPPPNQARPQFRRWNLYNVPKTISERPSNGVR